MVSSRGFALDSYHLIGLIPFCDMFNHSSSPAHTSLSVDPDVCEHCGSLLQCEHDGPNSERLESLPEAYLAKLEADGMADMVDMRVQREIMAGKQVFSCYDDEHADAELLVEYGFIEGGNTAITWPYREFLDPARPESAQRFMALLQRDSQIAEDDNSHVYPLVGTPRDQQPEPLVIRPNGEVSSSLALILFNGLADDGESVETVGEDLEAVLRKLRTRDDMTNPQVLLMANVVCSIIQKRLDRFRHSELTLKDLRSVVDVSYSYRWS